MEYSKISEVVTYLVDKLRKYIPKGMGQEDVKVNKATEADLCNIYEDCIYRDGNGRFLYSKSGRLMVYTGKGFEADESGKLLQESIKLSMSKLGVAPIYQMNSAKKIAEECMAGMAAISEYWFIADRSYIVFENCVLKLCNEHGVKAEVLEHSEKYRTDLILDFEYKADATSPLWESFYNATIPNREMQRAFQMFCGALLSSRENFQIDYMCFLLGPGGNGKSVLARAISGVFGPKLFSRFSPHQLFQNTPQSMYNIAALDGKIANLCDDVTNSNFATGDFKTFVSGEPLTGRHPYGRQIFEVKPPYMICCANEMPSSVDDTEGYHRRILPILSTTHSYSEEERDTQLGFKLSSVECRQAIFQFYLEGFYMVRDANGNIELGAAVRKAQRDLRDDNNSMRRWLKYKGYGKSELESPLKRTKNPNWRKFQDLYNEYVEYCRENNDGMPQKPRQLKRLLEGLNLPFWRRNDGYCYYIEKSEVEFEPEDVDVRQEVVDYASLSVSSDELPF